MQTASQAWIDALAGTIVPVCQVDAWYDGQLIAADLPVIAGSSTVSVDTTRMNVGTASITCGSPDASVLPDSWRSALACYGTVLHVRAGFQIPGSVAEMKSLGWFRVDSYSTVEAWQPYRRYLPGDGPLFPSWDVYPSEYLYPNPAPRADQVSTWVSRGVQVVVQCSDLMSTLDDAAFFAPEQPASLTSAQAEIIRLCQEPNVTVDDLTGVADAAIPRSLTYAPSRQAAIQSLAALCGCVAYMSPDGGLALVDTDPGASVWTVGVDDGVPPVQAWTRQGDRVGLYNAVVSSSTSPAGTPLQAIATEATGPLRYGGPFGMVPYTRQAPFATTQAACQADADTTLANLIARRTVVVPLTLPSNYALQPWDVITAQLPDRTLSGQVTAIRFPLGVGQMTASIAVGRAALWAA